MHKSFPMVPLGDVVHYRKEFIQIDDLKNYKRCRVQLNAQGVVLRDIVTGAEVKTKTQQVCRAGEFLVAEIDAKMGGFGIVPEDLEGAIVSSHYFLFIVDEERLERKFLDFFIRTPYFRDQVTAQGTTNYAAIRPDDVLGYKLPLPSLDEQDRIVTWIEELAAKVKEARGLRRQAVEEVEALIASASKEVFQPDCYRQQGMIPLSEIAEIRAGVTLGRTPVGKTIRVPYLRVANVQDGQLDLSLVKEIGRCARSGRRAA